VPALFAAILVVLSLFVSAPAAAQFETKVSETEGGRHLLLSADVPGQDWEVRICPSFSTTLLFDGTVMLVELEAREHFRRVTVAEDSLILMPSRELMPGRRLRMVVRFVDGRAPASVDFVLVVVPPAQVEQQVEVYRSRLLEEYQREAREVREKARQCEAELARERAKPEVLGGLTGLLASMQMDQTGVPSRVLKAFSLLSGTALQLWTATSYLAARPRDEGEMKKPRVVRVAVDLRVTSADGQPWTAEGAELVAENSVRWKLSVWQQGPIVPGSERQRVVVEAEMLETEARGTFTLELWEAGGARRVTFGGVSFP
jgi:uncharacterized protein (TIGR02268 family)